MTLSGDTAPWDPAAGLLNATSWTTAESGGWACRALLVTFKGRKRFTSSCRPRPWHRGLKRC
ncbi:hypothetical protein [Nonomuraea sp. JJY05]|uniref:hypothetical protein n=1 Tax=Nonomuraea sp. JJY05 TaxID=3350255 RepID=UPI00373E9E65